MSDIKKGGPEMKVPPVIETGQEIGEPTSVEGIEKKFEVRSQRFMDGVMESGGKIERFFVDEKHPVDVAEFGDKDAENLVIVVAGTHGLEGWSGSDAYLDLLKDKKDDNFYLPENTRLVLIHGLNSYGMAKGTRGDKGNGDINRTFLPEGVEVPKENEISRELKKIAEEGLEQDPNFLYDLDEVVDVFYKRYPRPNPLKVNKKFLDIAEGQYTDPEWIFYGGDPNRKSSSAEIYEQILSEYSGNSSNVTVMDFHTGLGPKGMPIVFAPGEGDANLSRVKKILTGEKGYPVVFNPFDQEKSGEEVYEARGDLLSFSENMLKEGNSNREVTTLAMEMGSGDEYRFVAILIKQAYAKKMNNEEKYEEACMELYEYFYPNDKQWRRVAVDRFKTAIVEMVKSKKE